MRNAVCSRWPTFISKRRATSCMRRLRFRSGHRTRQPSWWRSGWTPASAISLFALAISVFTYWHGNVREDQSVIATILRAGLASGATGATCSTEISFANDGNRYAVISDVVLTVAASDSSLGCYPISWKRPTALQLAPRTIVTESFAFGDSIGRLIEGSFGADSDVQLSIEFRVVDAHGEYSSVSRWLGFAYVQAGTTFMKIAPALPVKIVLVPGGAPRNNGLGWSMAISGKGGSVGIAFNTPDGRPRATRYPPAPAESAQTHPPNSPHQR